MRQRSFKYKVMSEIHYDFVVFTEEVCLYPGQCESMEDVRSKLEALLGGFTRWNNDVFGEVRKVKQSSYMTSRTA